MVSSATTAATTATTGTGARKMSSQHNRNQDERGRDAFEQGKLRSLHERKILTTEGTEDHRGICVR